MGFCSFGMTPIVFELARCSFGMTLIVFGIARYVSIIQNLQYYDNCLQYDIVNNL